MAWHGMAWETSNYPASRKLPAMYSDSTLRRRARRQGVTLVKFSPGSQWYYQYGPYALREGNRALTAWGLDADGVLVALLLMSK